MVGLDYCRWRSQYLAELLQEHQKLGPFMQVLPICSRLLNQGERFDPSFVKTCCRCYVSCADSIAAAAVDWIPNFSCYSPCDVTSLLADENFLDDCLSILAAMFSGLSMIYEKSHLLLRDTVPSLQWQDIFHVPMSMLCANACLWMHDTRNNAGVEYPAPTWCCWGL